MSLTVDTGNCPWHLVQFKVANLLTVASLDGLSGEVLQFYPLTTG